MFTAAVSDMTTRDRIVRYRRCFGTNDRYGCQWIFSKMLLWQNRDEQ